MHRVDIWPITRDGTIKGPFVEPSIAVGYNGKQLFEIHPQMEDGSGYGLTVTDMHGKVLLVADLTVPPTPETRVFEAREEPVYRFPGKEEKPA